MQILLNRSLSSALCRDPVRKLCRASVTTTNKFSSSSAAASTTATDSEGNIASKPFVPQENTVMTSTELETLRIKGGRLEMKQLNSVANILSHRMTERLPTLLEFQGPQATMNAVKAVTNANGKLKQRKKIENVTEEEFAALEEYLKDKKDVAKIESDFKYYEKFSEHEGYNVLTDILADNTAQPAFEAEASSDSEASDSTEASRRSYVRDIDPSRIPLDIDGNERLEKIKEKLSRRKSGEEPIKHVLVSTEKPLVLGIIPSQFRVQNEQGYSFVMRLEPVIISEPKENLVKEKCKLIFPPRDRDMLFQSATILRKLWTEHLNQNGPELLCCASGAESVSKAIKMLECANTLQEKNSATQFCVRPQMIKETSNDDTDMVRVHYQFDFYAL